MAKIEGLKPSLPLPNLDTVDQKPTSRTNDKPLNTDIVKKPITSRKVQATLATFGKLFSRLATATKPILTKVGIFKSDDKSLAQMIALETKLSTTYKDVAIKKDDLKDGIEQKNIHALKLVLAELGVYSEDALKIVNAYGKKADAASEEKDQIKFDKESLQKILGDTVDDKNIDKILKSADENISIRSILAKLVNNGLIGKKTAIVADTLYRLSTKLLAAAVLLTSTVLMISAAGFTLPLAAIVIVSALVILATAANVIKDGVETFKAETKKQASEKTEVEVKEDAEVKKEESVEEKADISSLEKANAKVKALMTTLKAFFEKIKTLIDNAKDFIKNIKKLDEKTGIKSEVVGTVTAEVLDPFKKVIAGCSKIFAPGINR